MYNKLPDMILFGDLIRHFTKGKQTSQTINKFIERSQIFTTCSPVLKKYINWALTNIITFRDKATLRFWKGLQ